ncbi:MAG: sugar phosphate isomerase/epimerase [Bacteroidota bacterium]
MISFGVSTWLWTSPFSTDTLALFPKLKQMGFDAVEIPVEYPELIDPVQTLAALKQYDLKPIICGAFGPSRDLTHDDPKVHQNCFDYLQACFELSNQLGAKFVAGPMYSSVGKARLLSPDERKREWELAVGNLHKVCQMAAANGQSIALEPLNRFETDLVNTASDIARMVADINHPAAKIMLDSFHMTIEERDLAAAFVAVKDHLIHVQVSENYRGIPGTGLSPWQSFKAGLEAIDYQGVVSIESFTTEIKELAGAVCFWKPMADSQDQFATEGLAFLKQLFNS